jgi:hypothetical protein
MDQDARADVCLCRIGGIGKIDKARSIMLLHVWAELRMLFALEAAYLISSIQAFLLIYDTG